METVIQIGFEWLACIGFVCVFIYGANKKP